VPTAQEIQQRIEAAIPGASAEVEDYTGGGDHFRATVSSPAFAGRSRIEQHKLVYGVFGDEIGGAIHALSLKTQAPQEPGTTSPTEGQAIAGDEQQHAAATT
jgi:stress-induced morphogen